MLLISLILIYLFSLIEAQFPPKLSFSGANPNKKYIIIGLDLDPPFPSFPFLGPVLHWIQTGLTIATAADQATGLLSVVGHSSNDTTGATTTATTTTTTTTAATTTTTVTVVLPLASYHPPRPPPGSSPHRYVFLLYEQPEDFDRQVDRKPIGLSDRPRFDYNGFLERAGLGEVVAVNYYLSK
jgi:phosphatidylethanolamine-binding protein